MTSDEDRREVAARLRKAIGLKEFAEVLGFNWTDDSDWVWNDVSNLVADLIEPHSTIPTDPGEAGLASVEGFIREMRHSTEEEQSEYRTMLEKKSVELHPVDREALLALADELEWRYEAAASPGELGYVNAGEMAECASRIRDALGAEDA